MPPGVFGREKAPDMAPQLGQVGTKSRGSDPAQPKETLITVQAI